MATAIVPAIFLGIVMGFLTKLIFDKAPEKWLQDYGYDPTAPDFRLSKRMRLIPETVIAILVCCAFYLATAILTWNTISTSGLIIRLCVIILMIPDCVLVMMSDHLNRIIPDQFTLFILILGVISTFDDYIEGSIWFSSEANWYYPLVNRLLAAFLGYGVLWLIEFICQTFLGREGMGQGDMKLLGACGLLCGMYGMVVLIYVGIFAALFFAIPKVINKRIRINKEEKMIRESADPIKTRRELKKAKQQIHFADDPDYLAFGPFLSFGAAVFIALEPFFYNLILPYVIALGVYF